MLRWKSVLLSWDILPFRLDMRNLITEMQFKGCRLKLFWLDDGIEDKDGVF